MPAEIRALYLSTGHDFRGRHGLGRLDHGIEQVQEVRCVAGQGLEGDRYFGYKEDYKGQITFFDWKVYEQLVSNYPDRRVDPSLLRRNVLIDGVDLNSLVARRFRVGGVLFEGSEECAPCYWMNDAIGPGAEDALRGRGGLRARIVEGGVLRAGAAELTLE
ncbi:MAG: molybdenum cofactor biosysynthesis protein [Polyangiaceae bacterium]|nr:molybdenum cofactor biosysynthesis protein [Polyangiaceae bacterium]